MKETSFEDFLNETMKDSEFKKAWDSFEEEFAQKEASYEASKQTSKQAKPDIQ